jgi:hypothetical protein
MTSCESELTCTCSEKAVVFCGEGVADGELSAVVDELTSTGDWNFAFVFVFFFPLSAFRFVRLSVEAFDDGMLVSLALSMVLSLSL